MGDSRAPGAVPILPGDSVPPQGAGSSKAERRLVSPNSRGSGRCRPTGAQSLWLFSPVLPAREAPPSGRWSQESQQPPAPGEEREPRALLLPWLTRRRNPRPQAPPSQHQEEDQHDQQDHEEDSDGTPLAPITGHVRHFSKFLHHIV